MRGWNVAIPEVDVGDDIFVVQDENGTLRRVQVKTSASTGRQASFSGQFQISIKQLRTINTVPVYYVFIARHNDTWSRPVIIRQDYLLDHHDKDKVGSKYRENLNLYFSFSATKVKCSGKDFTKYVSDYTDFPVLAH